MGGPSKDDLCPSLLLRCSHTFRPLDLSFEGVKRGDVGLVDSAQPIRQAATIFEGPSMSCADK
jgi:hypothetical protein